MTASVFSGAPSHDRQRHHVVRAVYFAHGKPADAAPVECKCGWSGSVGTWDHHRKQASVSRAPTELEQFEMVS